MTKKADKVIGIITEAADAMNEAFYAALEKSGLQQEFDQAVLARDVRGAAEIAAILTGLGAMHMAMNKAMHDANDAGADAAMAFLDLLTVIAERDGEAGAEEYIWNLHRRAKKLAEEAPKEPIVLTSPGGNA
jgi:hypothetical protein